MAGTRYEWVDRDDLPEELTRHEGFELDGNRLKGVNEQGNSTGISVLGPTLIKVMLKEGWIKKVEGTNTPEMGILINLLQEQLRRSEEEKEALRTERDELKQQLDERLGQFEAQLGEFRAKLDKYEEGVDGYNIGDMVGWITEDDAESYGLGYVVVGYTDEGKIKIRDLDTKEVHEVGSDELSQVDDLEDEDEEDEDEAEPEYDVGEDVGLRSGRGFLVGFEVAELEGPDTDGEYGYKLKNQADGTVNPTLYRASQLEKRSEITDDQIVTPDTPPPLTRRYVERRGIMAVPQRIGGFLVGRQVRLHNGAYNVYDRWGRNPRREVTELEAVEYSDNDRRVGAAALGGFIVGGLVAYAIDKIWDYYVEPHHGVPNPIPKNNGVPVVPGHTTTIIEHPVTGGGGRHLDHYRPGLGWKSKTAVENPANLQLRGAVGHKYITDGRGSIVVPHRFLDWDQQGNLSRITRAYLRARNYVLTQSHVPRHLNRRMTEIWQR